jgi:ABC-type phosphate/phosphonate transport system permease subunit
MAKTKTASQPAMNSIVVVLSSLLIPGLGQFLSNKRGRGLMIFLSTAVLVYLVSWSLVHQDIGKIDLVGFVTSWLWLPLILFWIWNVLDARAVAIHKTFNLLPGILVTCVILYVIAWSVTDVRFDSLIKRFGDARIIVTNLLNPDVITMNVNGVDKICAWSCMYTYLSDKLDGLPVEGPIRPSDNLLQILGEVKPMLAPKWEVLLGLAEPDSKINTFVAGSMLQTIAMGLMATIFSTILATPISFFAARNIMSRIPGGGIIYYVARGFLNIVRAVDTIVWGLIVIVWVGLGPFAGVIALTIHSIAALGKLFSEEIEHIDQGRQSVAGYPLCHHPANRAILPGIFTLALGYQYAFRDSHRICGRRRHRLFCSRKCSYGRLPAVCNGIVGSGHRHYFGGLHQ